MFLLYKLFSRFVAKVLLKWYGSKVLPSGKYEHIYSALDAYADSVKIKAPIPCVFDFATPIMLTLGSGDKFYVLISTGSLKILSPYEIESLLAREIAQIDCGYVPLNTLVSMLAGMVASVSTVVQKIATFSGFGNMDDPAPRFLRFLAMGLVALPTALIVHIFSINSTYEADRKAAEILGGHDKLEMALERTNYYIQLHLPESFNPGHVQLSNLNPLKVTDIFDIYNSMFLLRPGIKERLNNLHKNAYKIKSAGDLHV